MQIDLFSLFNDTSETYNESNKLVVGPPILWVTYSPNANKYILYFIVAIDISGNEYSLNSSESQTSPHEIEFKHWNPQMKILLQTGNSMQSYKSDNALMCINVRVKNSSWHSRPISIFLFKRFSIRAV